VVALALTCAFVRGQFTTNLSQLDGLLRFLMATMAYAGAGLLVVEVSNNRRRLVEHYARLELEQRLRRKAEEQLRILVQSSPAAILTLDAEARVVAANRAAHEMFGFEPGGITGESITPHFPVFQRALSFSPPGGRPVRSSVSGWARRKDDSTFPVQAWFSTYGMGEEHALAAIVVDMSEEVRDRERENFRQLVDHHRLLAGAVSHEIRNLCSAASVVCANLGRAVDLSASADFEALRNLVNGLTRIASIDLRRDQVPVMPTDLQTVLDQLLVVIEPDWTEVDGRIRLEGAAGVQVMAEAHGLLQIFLNLSQNSHRAVAGVLERELRISVVSGEDAVTLRFEDTGPGVQEPAVLFQPFRPEADGSGLGLYVSRALARSFGGDLLYVPTGTGCRFDLILQSAGARG
ncbi:MAG: HAMP domain-containing histidine kinase, partial [Bryobacterales bacterium]|nr:HAMP domain-containing histidine kinase [Bryobacterales bacterium]